MRCLGIVLALMIVGGPAHADDGDGRKGVLGVGIILGEPTGISARLYVKDDQAIQAAVGSAFIGGGWQLHADYVFHPFVLQQRESFVLPFYVGPGIRAIDYTNGRGTGADASYFAVGLRAVAGLLFDFKNVPLDAFIEVAGIVEEQFSGHGGHITFNAGAGARYYF